MKSASAITYELDNTPEAARQLIKSIRGQLDFERYSVGILLCDADTDGAALSAELGRLLGIEIAGMTTLSTIDSGGRHESAAVLFVMSADDCIFKTAVSAPLDTGDYGEKIAAAYNAALPPDEMAGKAPGLIFAFCPNGMPYSGDRYTEVLSSVSNNAPVIGGVACDDYDYVEARTLINGVAYKSNLVLINIYGNIKPGFAIKHITSRYAERKRRVTDALGNTVHRIGDETLIEYLEGFGLNTNLTDTVLSFTSYPMMLKRDDGDEVPLMRNILSLNHEDGSGTFFGDVPVGALANMCLINKSDIKVSCAESMKLLLSHIGQSNDYKYSSVFCVSCAGRAMILGQEADAEGSVLSGMLPQNMALVGAYCLGEICPISVDNGAASNRFHNCSITLCMF